MHGKPPPACYHISAPASLRHGVLRQLKRYWKQGHCRVMEPALDATLEREPAQPLLGNRGSELCDRDGRHCRRSLAVPCVSARPLRYQRIRHAGRHHNRLPDREAMMRHAPIMGCRRNEGNLPGAALRCFRSSMAGTSGYAVACKRQAVCPDRKDDILRTRNVLVSSTLAGATQGATGTAGVAPQPPAATWAVRWASLRRTKPTWPAASDQSSSRRTTSHTGSSSMSG